MVKRGPKRIRNPRLKRQVQFTIDPDLLDGLATLKARDGAPASELVRRAIRALLIEKGIFKK